MRYRNERFEPPTMIEAAHFKSTKDKETIERIIAEPEIQRQRIIADMQAKRQANIERDLKHFDDEDKKIRKVDRIKEIYAKSQKVRGKK